MNTMFIIIGVIVIIAIAAAVMSMNQEPLGPGPYDDFAQCLTSEGAVMYGTDSCTYCKAQKADFGNSFQYINYVNCDFDSGACDAAGVRGFPTWTYELAKLEGKQSLNYLSDLTGCPLE